ncbi:MAG: hypothetical protein IJ645_07705 [Ruminococcus sp.]|nr:hypothetical protein [Ruminococcus sp.]
MEINKNTVIADKIKECKSYDEFASLVAQKDIELPEELLEGVTGGVSKNNSGKDNVLYDIWKKIKGIIV